MACAQEDCAETGEESKSVLVQERPADKALCTLIAQWEAYDTSEWAEERWTRARQLLCGLFSTATSFPRINADVREIAWPSLSGAVLLQVRCVASKLCERCASIALRCAGEE